MEKTLCTPPEIFLGWTTHSTTSSLFNKCQWTQLMGYPISYLQIMCMISSPCNIILGNCSRVSPTSSPPNHNDILQYCHILDRFVWHSCLSNKSHVLQRAGVTCTIAFEVYSAQTNVFIQVLYSQNSLHLIGLQWSMYLDNIDVGLKMVLSLSILTHKMFSTINDQIWIVQ